MPQTIKEYWAKFRPSWLVLALYLIPILRQTAFYRTYREDISDYTAIDSLAIFDITVFLLCIPVIIHYWPRTNRNPLRHHCLAWWIIYYIFCLFSFLWRVPGSSSLFIWYRAGSMLIMTIYTYLIFARFPSREIALKWLLNLIGFTMLSGFLKALSIGVLHTNAYSTNAAVLAIFILVGVKQGIITWKEYKWHCLIAIVCLVCGTSGGSNVAFLAGLIFYFNLSKNGFNISKFIISLCLLLIAYHFLWDYAAQIILPGKSVEGIESATGRTAVWETYLYAWRQSPWLGWGFAVGERSAAYWGFIYVLSAHNGFLSVLVNTGLIGMIIWGNFLVPMLYQAHNLMKQGNGYATAILVAMVVLLTNNLTVPTMGSNWGQLSCTVVMLLVFFVFFVLPQEDNQTT